MPPKTVKPGSERSDDDRLNDWLTKLGLPSRRTVRRDVTDPETGTVNSYQVQVYSNGDQHNVEAEFANVPDAFFRQFSGVDFSSNYRRADILSRSNFSEQDIFSFRRRAEIAYQLARVVDFEEPGWKNVEALGLDLDDGDNRWANMRDGRTIKLSRASILRSLGELTQTLIHEPKHVGSYRWIDALGPARTAEDRERFNGYHDDLDNRARDIAIRAGILPEDDGRGED